jgi:hypothetical protein
MRLFISNRFLRIFVMQETLSKGDIFSNFNGLLDLNFNLRQKSMIYGKHPKLFSSYSFGCTVKGIKNISY